MERVRIIAARVAHPEHRIGQDESARGVASVVGDARRVRAIARGTRIESRAVVLPPDQLGRLGSIQERNAIYEEHAPRLAEAASQCLSGLENVSFLVTASCTGYMVPGLDVHLAQALHLRPDTVRLPITEAGCAGGVVALARAVDYLRAGPRSALAVATELCSLAFHPDPEDGIEIVDCASMLVPCSRDVLGFRLTNAGFYPLLSRNLVEKLPGPTLEAITSLLCRNGLSRDDIGFWLVHPGGPRVLEALQDGLGIESHALRWSWQALRASGNTSSAAIIEVMSRYLDDPAAPRGWGVALAFGPGVSIELLLLHRC